MTRLVPTANYLTCRKGRWWLRSHISNLYSEYAARLGVLLGVWTLPVIFILRHMAIWERGRIQCRNACQKFKEKEWKSGAQK